MKQPLKFLDGSAVSDEYLGRVQRLINGVLQAEELVPLEELEEFAARQAQRDQEQNSMPRVPAATRTELADVMLAQARGWMHVHKADDGRLWGTAPGHSKTSPLPRPSLDWLACGPLLGLYGLSITGYILGRATVTWYSKEGGRYDVVADYEGDAGDASLRYIITLAAYEKIKAKQVTPAATERSNVEAYQAAIMASAI